MKVQRTAWTSAQAGVPVILVGDNGIGKTTCALEFAKILNMKAVKVALLGAAAEDLLGYPVVKEVERNGHIKKVTEYATHTWLDAVERGAVLILEEIARLDNDRMQNIVAQLLDKSLGQYNIPKDTIIIGTTNMDDVGGINEINYNVLTRAAWYNAEVGIEEEKKALITGRYDLEVTVKKLPEDWEKYIPAVRSHIGAFFTYRPSVFRRAEAQRSTTWPCPRTINMFLVPALAAALSVGYRKLEDYESIMTACCGPVFAENYVNWRSLYVNKEPAEIYDDIKRNDLDHSNNNLMIAYLTEVQAWMTGLENKEQAKEVWQVCMNFISNKLLDQAPEISVYLAFSFMQAKDLVNKIPPNLIKLLGDL